MKLKDISELSYIIVPAKMPKDCGYKDLYNRIFDFWNGSWEKTYASSGSPVGHWQDHFLRQDVIAALVSPTEVVGCHLYTFYNLNSHSTLASEYFKYIPSTVVQKLLNDSCELVMSMEYLCVSPEWKINSAGISIGKLLGALGSNLSKEMGASVALGMPISTTKVDKMMDDLGGVVLEPEIKKFGYNLKLMAIPTQNEIFIFDSKVKELAKPLWESRQNYSIENEKSNNYKKAA